MVLNKKEKKDLVIKLYNEGNTTRDIAMKARMSLRDIGIIIRELNREPEPKPSKSSHAKAFQMFSEGKNPIQVSITLDLSYDEITRHFNEYLSLKNKSEFLDIYERYGQLLPFIIRVIENLKKFELLDSDVNVLLDYLHQFKTLNDKKNQLQHEVNCLSIRKMSLENEFGSMDGKIPRRLFSSE